MKIAVMQPYFLPYIGYFQLMNAVDEFIVYDDVHYINRGWINKNSILIEQKSHFIQIPLKKASQNKLICSVEIQEGSIWKHHLMKMIQHAYARAPHYKEISVLIESILFSEYKTISELNVFAIQKILDHLNIQTKIVLSSSLQTNSEKKGQERILDICAQRKANQYINPIGGKELYNKEIFKEENIELNFLHTKTYKYQQYKHDFIPNLSILDVLMFNSKKETKSLIREYYELV